VTTADSLSPARRSRNMAAIRSKDTTPELAIRRLVTRLGYRYRLHWRGLPGKPDLVFTPRRKVIFVHGCFWHQHGKTNCLDGRVPKSNTNYWAPKLSRNTARDAENTASLRALGWGVLIIWDRETFDQKRLAAKIQRFLEKP
jgi:DNA mismatch endonuclease, patch repair protein